MIYIVEEVLPAFWDKNLKEKEHFRGENWGFKSDKVGDGRAWDSLLQSMLAGILVSWFIIILFFIQEVN